MPPAVSICSVSKRYGTVQAVEAVNLSVDAGEIFGLIGPNGAGKTTLLECVMGLTSPDTGTVQVEDIPIGREPEKAKTLVGAQLQHSALPDAMTPREALTLCASFHRQPAAPSALLGRFQLEEKADSRYSTLSAGQRQRLALALALVGRPRVLVLDEPTAGLDPASRADLHRLIRELPATGCTVLFSTHYLEEARQLCGRVAVMHRGRILARDTPESLIAASGARTRVVVRTRPRLSDRWLGQVEAAGAEPAGEDGWTIPTAHPHRALAAVLRQVETEGAELLDVRLHPPTLDDAFASLTGREP